MPRRTAKGGLSFGRALNSYPRCGRFHPWIRGKHNPKETNRTSVAQAAGVFRWLPSSPFSRPFQASPTPKPYETRCRLNRQKIIVLLCGNGNKFRGKVRDVYDYLDQALQGSYQAFLRWETPPVPGHFFQRSVWSMERTFNHP